MCRWYRHTVRGGRDRRFLDVRRVVRPVEAAGAGEILLHRIIDRNGPKVGFDLEPIDAVKRIVGIPGHRIEREAGNPGLFAEISVGKVDRRLLGCWHL